MTHEIDPLGPEARFAAFLAEGKFMIQRSRVSGRHVFYPRIAEPGTGDELEWVEPSGMGTVYSTIIVYPKPPAQPYNVALVDLDEGPRMLSRIEGVTPDKVAIGMRVKAHVGSEDGTPLVLFRPTDDGTPRT
jgi:uncharacterized OB-fold protein